MFKSGYVFHNFSRTCPPDHNLRNVFGALPLRYVELPGRPSGHLSHHDRPDFRDTPSPPRITSPRSPRSAPSNLHDPTTNTVNHPNLYLPQPAAPCIRTGLAEWGGAAGVWNTPKQERANQIQALPALTGRVVKCHLPG